MAKLPVDPRYSKVLLSAAPLGCVADAIAVVAMASADNMFVVPACVTHCHYFSPLCMLHRAHRFY